MQKYREEGKNNCCIFGSVVSGVATFPRGCTGCFTLSVQLNVYVPSTSLRPPQTSRCSLTHSAIPTPENPSRPSLNHTLFVSRQPRSPHNRRKKKVSIEQENPPCALLASFRSLSTPHLSISLIAVLPRSRIDRSISFAGDISQNYFSVRIKSSTVECILWCISVMNIEFYPVKYYATHISELLYNYSIIHSRLRRYSRS